MPDFQKHESYFMCNCCFGLPMPPRALASVENPLRWLLRSLPQEVHFQAPQARQRLFCDRPRRDCCFKFQSRNSAPCFYSSHVYVTVFCPQTRCSLV